MKCEHLYALVQFSDMDIVLKVSKKNVRYLKSIRSDYFFYGAVVQSTIVYL